MIPVMQSCFGNPSSGHPLGRRARDVVETARKQVASLVQSDPDEVQRWRAKAASTLDDRERARASLVLLRAGRVHFRWYGKQQLGDQGRGGARAPRRQGTSHNLCD